MVLSLDVHFRSALVMVIVPVWMVHVYVTRYMYYHYTNYISKNICAVFIGLDWCGM